MHTPCEAAVLTISDSTYHKTRQDVSGQTLCQLVIEAGIQMQRHLVLPDEHDLIVQALQELCVIPSIRFIFTTGGTGIGPRDVTPEATQQVIERVMPGIAEAMRAEGLKKTPFAMTSRQLAGVKGNTLIVNFPGSPKAVQEGFAVISPILSHVRDLLDGHTEHR